MMKVITPSFLFIVRMFNTLLDRLTLACITLVFFLIPIAFLPWTQDAFEPAKQIVLVSLTGVGVLAWLGRMFLQRRVVFRAAWPLVLPVVFLACVFVSSLLSKGLERTWMGHSSQEYVSFLTVSGLVVLFYLLVNAHEHVVAQRRAILALFASMFLVGIFAVLDVFQIFHLPFAPVQPFNTVGALNHLVLVMLSMMFFGLALWLVSGAGNNRVIPRGFEGGLFRLFIVGISACAVFLLVALNYWVYWVLVLFGVLLLVVFGFLQTSEFPSVRRFFFPLILLFASLFYLFLPSPFAFKVPVLVSPSYATTWHVAKSSINANVPDLFFGAGPGTFAYQFQLFKPASLNGTALWSTAFDRGNSAVLTRLSDLGLFGSVAWLLCMGWIGVAALRRLLLDREHETWKMTYALFVFWALLIAGQFVTSSNVTLEVLLWASSALLATHLFPMVWKSNTTSSPKMLAALSFVGILFLAGIFASFVLLGQKMMAEQAFSRAVAEDAKKADRAEVVRLLQKTIELNPRHDAYMRNMSFALLAQTSEKVRALGGKDATEEQQKDILRYATQVVEAGKRATALEPANVANWHVLGMMYREMMPFATSADTLAATAFAQAMNLEPMNPVHAVDSARVYIAVADREKASRASLNTEQAKVSLEKETQLLRLAEETLVSAVKRKGDYLPAHYYLAATYERAGKIEQATTRLVALAKNAPSDIGLGFELAQLYLRTDQLNLAKQELERILTLNPSYSNALWYLAGIEEQQQNLPRAIELVEKVVEMNPSHVAAKERLEKLRAGNVSTDLAEPLP